MHAFIVGYSFNGLFELKKKKKRIEINLRRIKYFSLERGFDGDLDGDCASGMGRVRVINSMLCTRTRYY